MNYPNLSGQHKNRLWVEIFNLSNELASLFKRCQFCLELDSLAVVKVDVFTYEETSLLIGCNFLPINTLGFEN